MIVYLLCTNAFHRFNMLFVVCTDLISKLLLLTWTDSSMKMEDK